MADKPYINLDDDLIDDYQSTSGMMAPPTPPANTILPTMTPTPTTTPTPVQNQMDYTSPSAKISATNQVIENHQTSDLSAALEQEMQDIEKQMYAVAVEGFNRKREQAHQDIDKLYDEMIAIAQKKLRGITVAIAEEVGE